MDKKAKQLTPNVFCEQCHHPLGIRPPGGPRGEEPPPFIYVRSARHSLVGEMLDLEWIAPDGAIQRLPGVTFIAAAIHEEQAGVRHEEAEARRHLRAMEDEWLDEFPIGDLWDQAEIDEGRASIREGFALARRVEETLAHMREKIYECEQSLKESDILGPRSIGMIQEQLTNCAELEAEVAEDKARNMRRAEQFGMDMAELSNMSLTDTPFKGIENKEVLWLNRMSLYPRASAYINAHGFILLIRKWKRTARIDIKAKGQRYKIEKVGTDGRSVPARLYYKSFGDVILEKKVLLPVDAEEVPQAIRARCPECGHVQMLC